MAAKFEIEFATSYDLQLRSDPEKFWSQPRVISSIVPPLGHVERIVERNVVLQNAVYRLSRVEQAWTRYLIFIFRYTAISEEKREGIIRFGINLINGSAIDHMVDQLLATAINENAAEAATKPAPSQLPADWTAERLRKAITRAARKERYLFPVCLCDSERELFAFDSSDIDFHQVGRFSIRRQYDVHYFPRPARSRACLAALTDPPKVTTIRKEPKYSRNKHIFSRFASLLFEGQKSNASR